MARPGRPRTAEETDKRVRVDEQTFYDLKLLSGMRRKSEVECLRDAIRLAVDRERGNPTLG
jgi:hypothetical protein